MIGFKVPGDWAHRAACLEGNADDWHPSGDAASIAAATRRAVLICKSCEVVTDCLDYALKNDERWGLWGGLTADERGRLKRKQADA